MRRARISTTQLGWSAEDIATAAHIWRDVVIENAGTKSAAVREIAHALGRTLSSVENRRWNYGDTFDGVDRGLARSGRISVGGGGIPAHVLVNRERMQEAAYRRDLTASIFGDPPPGYSALDRRR